MIIMIMNQNDNIMIMNQIMIMKIMNQIMIMKIMNQMLMIIIMNQMLIMMINQMMMILISRFETPAAGEDEDEETQVQLIREATARFGVRAKLKGDEIYQEGAEQAPRFLLKMENIPKVRTSLNVVF